MKQALGFLAVAGVALLLTLPVLPQALPSPRHGPPPVNDEDVTLPSGKSQKDEILKENHEKDLKDATQLIELAEQLKQELEKNDRHVLSIASLKKTEEIEKLAKRIHSRLVQ